MFQRKVPFYLLILTALVSGGATYLFKSIPKNAPPIELTPSANASCTIHVDRLQGYKHIRPLLFAERACESDNYYQLKKQISDMIDNYKADGSLASASVYVRIFKNGEWISINEDEKFDPASMMKVPILITWLRMDEDHPGTLDKVLTLSGEVSNMKQQAFGGETIKIGRGYKVRDLLRYMIVNSDNMATALLNQNMDSIYFKNTLTDLGLHTPGYHDSSYPITASEYSRFMKALYNASYLNIHNSEVAAELLTHAEFDKGITHELPAGFPVAHKFGEAGDAEMHQIHESAIIYLEHIPYIITIMTRGKDLNKLPTVLSHISKVTFDYMSGIDKEAI